MPTVTLPERRSATDYWLAIVEPLGIVPILGAAMEYGPSWLIDSQPEGDGEPLNEAGRAFAPLLYQTVLKAFRAADDAHADLDDRDPFQNVAGEARMELEIAAVLAKALLGEHVPGTSGDNVLRRILQHLREARKIVGENPILR